MKSSFLRWLTLSCVAAALASKMAAVTVNLTVGLTDSHSLGDVINTLNAGGGQLQRDVSFVNTVLALPLGGTDSTTYPGDIVTRSNNNFGALPAATATGGVINNGIPTFTNGFLELTLTSQFKYFVAAYDGPNGGTEAYYIGGLNVGDVIRITQNAEPSGTPEHLVASNNFQMTGWALLNPGGSGQTNVPDGGSTVALLGFVLAGLALIRRKLA